MVITHLFAYSNRRSKAYPSGWLKGVGGGCTWIEKLWFTTRFPIKSQPPRVSRAGADGFLFVCLTADSALLCFTVAHHAPRFVDVLRVGALIVETPCFGSTDGLGGPPSAHGATSASRCPIRFEV